ncbi:MAG: hypothetical protein PSN37_04760 [Alphaproteobacteria bacterium]|nr:hypothetical protein [Alphaproteobacteria bacterium]
MPLFFYKSLQEAGGQRLLGAFHALKQVPFFLIAVHKGLSSQMSYAENQSGTV